MNLKAVITINVKQRILAFKYMKKQQKHLNFANKLGVEVKVNAKDEKMGRYNTILVDLKDKNINTH